MKKNCIIYLAVLTSLFIGNSSFSEELSNNPNVLGQNTTQENVENVAAKAIRQPAATPAPATNVTPVTTEPTAQSTIPVSNVSPVLKAPVVQDPKLQKKAGNKYPSKLNLKAIIFDPNADFEAQAKDENRKMTAVENLEDNLHDALHGEVSSMSTLSKKGLFQEKMTYYPKGGILKSINEYTGYRGTFSNVWQDGDYKNTLDSMDSLVTTFEGKFRDDKTTFRSMFSFSKNKEGHTFFNDVWGDQYIQYAWTKHDQFLVGYKRNSLGVEGSMGPWALPLINRSQIDKAYNNVRALGVKAQGQHKMYEYTLELSSAGRNFIDWFPGPEVVTSFGLRPLGMTDGRYGNLLIGGAFNAGNAEGRYDVGAAYIDYEYKRFNATFEYGVADGSNGSTGYTANKSEGFNGTLAYRITKRLQALVRYDYFDPNKNKYNDIRQEYTVGMNYFLKDHSVQLMLNYTWYAVQSGLYGSRILLGTQILL